MDKCGGSGSGSGSAIEEAKLVLEDFPRFAILEIVVVGLGLGLVFSDNV